MNRGFSSRLGLSSNCHRLATSRALVSLLLQNNHRDLSGRGFLPLDSAQIPAFHCFREQLGLEDAYSLVEVQVKVCALAVLGVSSRRTVDRDVNASRSRSEGGQSDGVIIDDSSLRSVGRLACRWGLPL